MNLFIYNSLSRKIEEFIPYDAENIRIYGCGPTVYDDIHLGNARAFAFYDLVYRILSKLYGKEHITYIRNITDIDDKINDRAKKLGISIQQLTAKTAHSFTDDMQYLGLHSPTAEPKATEHIEDIIFLIQQLLTNDYAYIVHGTVYFAVEKFLEYFALSGRSNEYTRIGVRIELDEGKRDPADFVLWKPKTLDDDPSAIFASPWGEGRPGWHIECSAMSYKFLGADFDLHLGGRDLIFPHHTNEIAQSRCAIQGSHYAKYWLHNSFLTINGEKMSKSANNFLTIKSLQQQGMKGEVIKLFLLSTHYRKPLDFNTQALEEAQKTLAYCYRALGESSIIVAGGLPTEFMQALLDDLNVSKALSIMLAFAKESYKTSDARLKCELLSNLKSCSDFLGLLQHEPRAWFGYQADQAIEALIRQRNEAKNQRNWAAADQIRQQLARQGIILEDHSTGTTWRKI